MRAAELLLEIADDELILGWRDSEWTGIAPFLEEDVAFSSIAQNEIGHARALYELAALDLGTTADELAFDRKPEEYRCSRAGRASAAGVGADDRTARALRAGRRRSGTSTSPSPRCSAASRTGHRAVNFCNQPQDYGQPPLAHPHWDPIWAAAQEAGVSVSFHVGGGSMGTQFDDTAEMGWMTNFAKVSSLIFLDNIRCIDRPDLRRRVPPLPRPEARVGRVRRRLDPRRARGVRLAVAQRRRPRRAPRVRPAAERVLPAPDLRLLLVRGGGRARRASRATPTTSSTRPTTRTRPASTPGPRTPAQRPRDYATRVLGGAARRRAGARCCTTTPPRSTACDRDRDRSIDRPTSGRPYLVADVRGPRPAPAHRPGRSAATPSPRTCTAAIKRAAVWADEQPELDAVCLTGTDALVRRRRRHGRRGRATPRASPPSGTPPTSSRSATSSAARSCGSRGSTACATPAGSSSPLHCDVTIASDQARFRAPELLRGIPDPFLTARLADARRPGPGPLPALHRARRSTRPRPTRWAWSARSCPHDELDAARRRGASAQIARTGPTARAAVKRDLNQRLPLVRRRGCSSGPSARPRWSRAWPRSSRSDRRTGPAS